MRRLDVLRKVLMGGLATSRPGTGNQTNIGDTPDDATIYYQKWFTNSGTGATSVSPYSGARCFGIKDGYLYVGEDAQIPTRITDLLRGIQYGLKRNRLMSPRILFGKLPVYCSGWAIKRAGVMNFSITVPALMRAAEESSAPSAPI